MGVIDYTSRQNANVFEKLVSLYELIIGPIAGGLVGSLIGPFTTADIYRLEMDGSELTGKGAEAQSSNSAEGDSNGSAPATPPN